MLCGELLREAEKLVNQRLHPQVGLFIRPVSFCPPLLLLYEVLSK